MMSRGDAWLQCIPVNAPTKSQSDRGRMHAAHLPPPKQPPAAPVSTTHIKNDRAGQGTSRRLQGAGALIGTNIDREVDGTEQALQAPDRHAVHGEG